MICTDVELELRGEGQAVAGNVASYRHIEDDCICAEISAGRVGKALESRLQKLRSDCDIGILTQARIKLQLNPIDPSRSGVGCRGADRRSGGNLKVGIIVIKNVRIRPEAP